MGEEEEVNHRIVLLILNWNKVKNLTHEWHGGKTKVKKSFSTTKKPAFLHSFILHRLKTSGNLHTKI